MRFHLTVQAVAMRVHRYNRGKIIHLQVPHRFRDSEVRQMKVQRVSTVRV
jgi:hypothetical protein